MDSIHTINIRGELLDLSQPQVMGIINVTPDSFFSGSRKNSSEEILKTAEKMLVDGASFLDIGGYSSRPGADDISEQEELERVIPSIEAIMKEFPEAIISVDTFRAGVARAGIHSGAAMVNDISGGQLDASMLPTLAEMQVPYVAMHMRGTPQTMKELTQYEDVVLEVMHYFSKLLRDCNDLGINDVIIDPGFGFAKAATQSFQLLADLDHFRRLGRPLLVGLSRKSMIYRTLGVEANDALNGTTVLNTLALLRGASILRVHDVKEAMEVIKLVAEVN